MKKFVLSDRLDDFYVKLLSEFGGTTTDMMQVIKICLILSHGNARVESSFSINDNILETNMKEASVVAQRIAYEGIAKERGLLKVNVTKEMLSIVKNSWRFAKIADDENRYMNYKYL